MNPFLILSFVCIYFLFLMTISWFTGKNADNQSFFLANKQAPWYLIALGMISDSLSGVTYISVPGAVGKTNFYYLQIVLGYVLGYIIIAKILLPLYYKMNLTSIYTYLDQRFGRISQKTGSFFFLLSRTLGAAIRLYLSANVFQIFVFNNLGVPFEITVFIIILFMLAYTYKGGIKTLVWTDSLQSLFLLAGVLLSIIAITSRLNWSISDVFNHIKDSPYSSMLVWDFQHKHFFIKQLLSGCFIAIVMSGLDQNMMQKNLSCHSLKDAQKNIYWFSFSVVIVNLLFLSLGALLYIYSETMSIPFPVKSDDLFPNLAFNHLGIFASLAFLLGLTAATFSSADSVLTTLTTSFCFDFIRLNEKDFSEKKKIKIRHFIQICFGILLLIIIIILKIIVSDAMIHAILTLAGYTYGPLLGLFAFGLFTKSKPIEKLVPLVCLISPILCLVLDKFSKQLFLGYEFGFEMLIVNGLLTFVGLKLISGRKISNIIH